MSDKMKKPRGRPAGHGRGRGEGVMLRLHPPLIEQVDAWRDDQRDKPTRPEAIRRLVERGLAADAPSPGDVIAKALAAR